MASEPLLAFASDEARSIRVLVLTYQFPPVSLTGSLRLARFVRWLPSGFAAEVLTVAEPRERSDDRSLYEEVRDRARIHRVRALPWLELRGLDRVLSDPDTPGGRRLLARSTTALMRQLVWIPDREVAWARAARDFASRLLESGRFQAIVCSSPPHSLQLVGRDLRRRFGIPLVVDFRDPWTDGRLESWRHRRWQTPLHRLLERRMERSVLEEASAVIANTPTNRRMLLASFPGLSPSKVHVITNGYDPNRREEIESAQRRRESCRTQPGRLRLLYAGELYDGCERFLEALHRLASRDGTLPQRVVVKLLGTVGPNASRIADSLEGIGLLEREGRVPSREVPAELAAADALIYAVPPTTGHWIPSKLFDYLVARKPIVAVLPRGDAWEILEESGLATLIEDRGIDAVTRGLGDFVARLSSGEVRIDPVEEHISRFDGAVLTEKLATILREVVER